MTGQRVIAVAAIATVFGAAPMMAQLPPSADTGQVAVGRKLFEGKGLCFSCHGKNGEGVLGPTTRLAGRTLVHTKNIAAGIAALIKTGVDSAHSTSGNIMPPKGGSRLTDSEIDAVAAYVVQLQTVGVSKPDNEQY
ncbi:MAG TPA: cytochrome c [Gemmatimonadales bacterium]|jgi:mono/diheme cytochrome c family protein